MFISALYVGHSNTSILLKFSYNSVGSQMFYWSGMIMSPYLSVVANFKGKIDKCNFWNLSGLTEVLAGFKKSKFALKQECGMYNDKPFKNSELQNAPVPVHPDWSVIVCSHQCWLENHLFGLVSCLDCDLYFQTSIFVFLSSTVQIDLFL